MGKEDKSSNGILFSVVKYMEDDPSMQRLKTK